MLQELLSLLARERAALLALATELPRARVARRRWIARLLMNNRQMSARLLSAYSTLMWY